MKEKGRVALKIRSGGSKLLANCCILLVDARNYLFSWYNFSPAVMAIGNMFSVGGKGQLKLSI